MEQYIIKIILQSINPQNWGLVPGKELYVCGGLPYILKF